MSDKKRKRIEPALVLPGACVLCKTTINDDFRLGKFCKTPTLSAHYFCVLFACGLAQNGRSSREGIEGFLIKDILNEVNRGSRLRCYYCGLTGATVGCNIKKCPKGFHLPCGLDKGALNQFFGQFCTFCNDHKPNQVIPKAQQRNDILCTICYSVINVNDKDSFLKASCCASNWFHRQCIQLYANSAGYFFKCPLCNDKKDFKQEMLCYGIHIPKQDASWEKERNAFQELLVRGKCDAEKCLCPKGRQENKEHSVWRLIYCEDCGSTARHIKCENLTGKKIWKCSDCVEFNKKLLIKRKKEKQNRPGTSSENSSNANLSRLSQELLKQCKECFVKLEILQPSDLPKYFQNKYKNRLKYLKSKNSKMQVKSETHFHSFSGASTANMAQPSCSNVKKSNENKTCGKIKKQIVHRSCRFSSPIKATNNCLVPFKDEIKGLTLTQQKAKQTLIESFFGNKSEKSSITDEIIEKSIFENASAFYENSDAEKDKCLVQSISSTTYDSVVNCSFGNKSFTILRRKRHTANLYVKGVSSPACINDLLQQNLANAFPNMSLPSLQNLESQPISQNSFSKLALPAPENCENKVDVTETNKLKHTKNKPASKTKLSSNINFKKLYKLSSVYKKICLTATPRKLRNIKNKNSTLSEILRVYLNPEHISGVYVSQTLIKQGILSSMEVNLGKRCDESYKINAFGSCLVTSNQKSKTQLQKNIISLFHPKLNNKLPHSSSFHNQQLQTQKNASLQTVANTKPWKVVTLDEMFSCDKPPPLPKMDILPPIDPMSAVSNSSMEMPVLKESAFPTPIARLCSKKVTITNPLNAKEHHQLEKHSVIVPSLYNSQSVLKSLCTSNQINNSIEKFGNINSTIQTNGSFLNAQEKNFSFSNMLKQNGKLVATFLPSHFSKNLYSSIPRHDIPSFRDNINIKRELMPSAFDRSTVRDPNGKIISIKKEIDTILNSNNFLSINERKVENGKKMNMCVEKYLNKTGSVPESDTSSEKRKKRLKMKSDPPEKKPYQNNTILSYFFTM